MKLPCRDAVGPEHRGQLADQPFVAGMSIASGPTVCCVVGKVTRAPARSSLWRRWNGPPPSKPAPARSDAALEASRSTGRSTPRARARPPKGRALRHGRPDGTRLPARAWPPGRRPSRRRNARPACTPAALDAPLPTFSPSYSARVGNRSTAWRLRPHASQTPRPGRTPQNGTRALPRPWPGSLPGCRRHTSAARNRSKRGGHVRAHRFPIR